MYTFETLDIRGYRDEAIPNTFFRQQDETRHLALLLPGFAYSAQMPVLYYPGRLLTQRGADVLRVDYAYHQRPEFQALPGDERDRWLHADAAAACRTALAQRSYDRLTLVGKSIGTLAMGYLLTGVRGLPRTQCVWLTPLLRSEPLLAQIQQARPRSLFAIGTADPQYDAAKLAAAEQATGGRSVVIEGADHSLEVADGVMESIRALQQMMLGLHEWLTESQP